MSAEESSKLHELWLVDGISLSEFGCEAAVKESLRPGVHR